MKRPFGFGTFAAAGETFAALVVEDRVARLEPRLGHGATVRLLLDNWADGFDRLQSFADRFRTNDAEFALSETRPLPPVQPPGQLFQAGANYRQHLVELTTAPDDRMHRSLTDEERSQSLAMIDERAKTGMPYVFLGLTHALTGSEDEIVLPAEVEKPDWELELAAVIGRRARRVTRENALDVIAAYTICNDITARDRVFRPDVPRIGTDWLAGKNWPAFLPTGPYLVPAAHVHDPMNLRITLRLNGEVMQDATTADMMFDIGRLIEHITTIAELRPGDMLLTGSPSGNGVHHGRFLQPGDRIESSIEGLGIQRNTCVAEAGVLEPMTAADIVV